MANGFSLADVHLRGWPGLDSPERVQVAIQVLVDSGWIRRQSRGSDSGSRELYLINPAIEGYQAAVMAAESAENLTASFPTP